jgi:hypothetical protein
MQVRFLLAALLALNGCSYYEDASRVEGIIVTPGNFIAGSGVIDSVGVLRNARAPQPEPGTGGRVPDPHLYRLYIRMDNGGFQSVDVDNNTFAAGQAVELTNDGRVVHVSGMSLNDFKRR